MLKQLAERSNICALKGQLCDNIRSQSFSEPQLVIGYDLPAIQTASKTNHSQYNFPHNLFNFSVSPRTNCPHHYNP